MNQEFNGLFFCLKILIISLIEHVKKYQFNKTQLPAYIAKGDYLLAGRRKYDEAADNNTGTRNKATIVYVN